MRLWHESLITKLPRQQLLGQHRECCALRGGGGGKGTQKWIMSLFTLHINCLNTTN